MNIMLINHYAGSPQMGMEFRPYYLAREWVKLGHAVTIVAASYSHLRGKNPNCRGFETKIIDGIRYVFFHTPAYSGNSYKRVINIYTFVKQLKKYAKTLAYTYRPNAVISSSTYLLDFKPAEKIARLSGAVTCFEIHDIWPLSLQVMGGISPNHPAIRYLQRVEDRNLRTADRIVSILPHADTHIRERGVSTFNYHHIPNGTALDSVQLKPLPDRHAKLFSVLKSQRKYIILYAGGHAESNALDTLVDAAMLLPEQFAVVLVGNGIKKQQLIKRAGTFINKKIWFMDPVGKEQMSSLLNLADCLYIGAKKSPLYRYGAGMNKLYDYMLAKKPILYAVEASNNPVKEAKCGVSIPAEDARALAEAAWELSMLDPSRQIQMGENGYHFVCENHDYKTLALDFIHALQ